MSTKKDAAILLARPQVTWKDDKGTVIDTVPWIGAGPPPADRLVREAQLVKTKAAPKRVADAAEAVRAADTLTKELLIARRELAAKSSDLETYRQRCEKLGQVQYETGKLEAQLAEMTKQRDAAQAYARAANGPALVVAVAVDGALYDEKTVRLLRHCEREASSQLRSATLQVDGLTKTVTVLRGQLAKAEQDLGREKLEHEATQRRLAEARQKAQAAPVSAPVVKPIVKPAAPTRVRLVG